VIPEDIFDAVKQFMEQQIPFNHFLGMEVTHLGDGDARLEVPFRDEFIGDPFRPALHGGVISALLDTCGGAAVFTTLQDVAERASTVDLRVDYLRPGRKERLIAEAKVIRAGNKVAVVSLMAYHPGENDRPVATGIGVYDIKRVKNGSGQSFFR
jgi:uncharacterized protein (TIGR00369 family)